MSDRHSRINVARTLIDNGVVGPDQVQEAKTTQELLGGELSYHLFRLGHVNYATYFSMLQNEYGDQVVDIHLIKPQPESLKFLSADDAWACRALPYEFDSETNRLKIACVDPDDSEVLAELTARIPDVNLELNAAVAPVLECTIIETYRHLSVDDCSSCDQSDQHDHAIQGTTDMSSAAALEDGPPILMVTSYPATDQRLAESLIRDGHMVVVVNSAEEAETYLGDQEFVAMIVRGQHSDYEQLVEKCSTLLPGCVIRFYQSLVDLLAPAKVGSEFESVVERDLRVLVLSEVAIEAATLQTHLDRLTFDPIIVPSEDEFVKRHCRDQPDILVVVHRGPAGELIQLAERLTSSGVLLDQVPAYALMTSETDELPEDGITHGFKEVVHIDQGIDQLLVKLCRTRAHILSESYHKARMVKGIGTHGTLEDMNLIDMFQALRSNDKTVAVSVTAEGEHLTMYLDRGQLVYARCGDLTGAPAIFHALTWAQGVWSMDRTSPDDLPESNNHQSIDAILIQGCTLLDERSNLR